MIIPTVTKRFCDTIHKHNTSLPHFSGVALEKRSICRFLSHSESSTSGAPSKWHVFYCRQHFLSGNTERSSCHCHRLSSALTNTREPLPGLIPLLTEIDVVTCTMSLLLEQLFLFISIFCYRSHVNASKGSCGRMNGLRLCISHLTAFQRHFLGQHAPLFSKCHKKVFKSTGWRAGINKHRNTDIRALSDMILNTVHHVSTGPLYDNSWEACKQCLFRAGDVDANRAHPEHKLFLWLFSHWFMLLEHPSAPFQAIDLTYNSSEATDSHRRNPRAPQVQGCQWRPSTTRHRKT